MPSPASSDSDSSTTPSGGRALLRHPLVVGAAVAIIGAVFASLLIPSITQVTQDRPKELELKRAIVERIADSTGTAVHRGVALTRGDALAAGGRPGQALRSVFLQVQTDWDVDASAVDGEIVTYFGHGDAWRGWRTLHDSITHFLNLTTVQDHNVRASAQQFLCGHLGDYVSAANEKLLRNDCADPNILIRESSFSNVILGLALLLEDERDAITAKIVETPAAGFRHSPWSLG